MIPCLISFELLILPPKSSLLFHKMYTLFAVVSFSQLLPACRYLGTWSLSSFFILSVPFNLTWLCFCHYNSGKKIVWVFIKCIVCSLCQMKTIPTVFLESGSSLSGARQQAAMGLQKLCCLTETVWDTHLSDCRDWSSLKVYKMLPWVFLKL